MLGSTGIGISDVTLDPRRKTRETQVCTGLGIPELTVGGAAGASAVADEYARATKSYDANPIRKAKALAHLAKIAANPVTSL